MGCGQGVLPVAPSSISMHTDHHMVLDLVGEVRAVHVHVRAWADDELVAEFTETRNYNPMARVKRLEIGITRTY